MQCQKCKSDLPSDSKFCKNCGAKVEEKSLIELFHEAKKSIIDVWFMIGYLKGISIKDKDKKLTYAEFEKDIVSCGLGEDYKEADKFLKELIDKANPEIKSLVNKSKT